MINGNKVRLRNKQISDAINDYSWRSDAELASLDAVPPISLDFARYIKSYTGELSYSSFSGGMRFRPGTKAASKIRPRQIKPRRQNDLFFL